ncbi:MAG: murein L,D-transpeptidase catalytic domain family protein [Sulfurovaceae bacterium]|nr:murein L,D-transpeptidase catalytic domain family protein [Sulfurovaceae bacterium]
MKQLIYMFTVLLFVSITVEAKEALTKQTTKSTKSIEKPKKRFISEWRKEQWRKERLAKAKNKKSLSKKSSSKTTTTKKKKYVSEWRKAQWAKAAKKKAQLVKKKKKVSNSKWKKPTKKIKVVKKRVVKKRKITKKRKSKKLNKHQVRKLNKIYKKVSKKTNINKRALKKAFSYYKKNKHKKALSSKYLAIADYTKRARDKRLYIINLKSGAVHRHKVAHGKYSGSVGGKVRRSSNRRNSKMTPYGFFKVGSRVGRTQKKGYKYLSVKGLDRSNRKVGCPTRHGGRDVIVHTARYVNSGGRSHGCFAIRPRDKNRVFSKLKKALLYSYTGR